MCVRSANCKIYHSILTGRISALSEERKLMQQKVLKKKFLRLAMGLPWFGRNSHMRNFRLHPLGENTTISGEPTENRRLTCPIDDVLQAMDN